VEVSPDNDWRQSWTRSAEPPTEYPLRRKLADMWHGIADGWKRLPSRREGQGAAPAGLVMPHLTVLSRQAMIFIQTEKRHCDDDIAGLLGERAAKEGLIDGLKSRICAAETRVIEAQKPPDETDLGIRRTAEKDHGSRPDELTRARRKSDHAWRLRQAEKERDDLVDRLARTRAEIASIEESIEARQKVAAAVARRAYEHGQMRINVYLRHLLRAHRRRHELAVHIITADYRLPGWADDPEQNDDGGNP